MARFSLTGGNEDDDIMNPEYAIEMLKQSMLLALTLAAPVLLASMIIGLVVSLFQAVTSIHEQTLSFVPKLVGIIGLLIFMLPWMTRHLMEFTIAMIERMPQMVR